MHSSLAVSPQEAPTFKPQQVWRSWRQQGESGGPPVGLHLTGADSVPLTGRDLGWDGGGLARGRPEKVHHGPACPRGGPKGHLLALSSGARKGTCVSRVWLAGICSHRWAG